MRVIPVWMESLYTLRGSARHAARLVAVQLLYQIEQSDGDAEAAVDQFHAWHRALAIGGGAGAAVDLPFLDKLVCGAVAKEEQLLPLFAKHLARNWSVERLPSVLRKILIAATYEFYHTDVPAPVILNEYIDIAKDFYEPAEVAFVNGVLDRVYHDREAERADGANA